MGADIPSRLLTVMVHSLMLDNSDPELKKDVLQHLLGKCFRLLFKRFQWQLLTDTFYSANG